MPAVLRRSATWVRGCSSSVRGRCTACSAPTAPLARIALTPAEPLERLVLGPSGLRSVLAVSGRTRRWGCRRAGPQQHCPVGVQVDRRRQGVAEGPPLGLERPDQDSRFGLPGTARDQVDVRAGCAFDVHVVKAEDSATVDLVQRCAAGGAVADAVEPAAAEPLRCRSGRRGSRRGRRLRCRGQGSGRDPRLRCRGHGSGRSGRRPCSGSRRRCWRSRTFLDGGASASAAAGAAGGAAAGGAGVTVASTAAARGKGSSAVRWRNEGRSRSRATVTTSVEDAAEARWGRPVVRRRSNASPRLLASRVRTTSQTRGLVAPFTTTPGRTAYSSRTAAPAVTVQDRARRCAERRAAAGLAWGEAPRAARREVLPLSAARWSSVTPVRSAAPRPVWLLGQ